MPNRAGSSTSSGTLWAPLAAVLAYRCENVAPLTHTQYGLVRHATTRPESVAFSLQCIIPVQRHNGGINDGHLLSRTSPPSVLCRRSRWSEFSPCDRSLRKHVDDVECLSRGQTEKSGCSTGKSALPTIADILRWHRHVSKVPTGDIARLRCYETGRPTKAL
jgi:hypothetical protein